MTIRTPEGITVQPGDFAAVHRSDFVSGTLVHIGEVLAGDSGNYEHAITYVGGPQDLILQAMPSGAQLLPFAESGNNLSDCLWSTPNAALNLTAVQQLHVSVICDALKGVPYSWLDYDALAAHRLHIPLPGLKEFIADSHHQICSQMVDDVRLLLGFHLFNDNRWFGYVMPDDIATVITG